MTAHYAGDANHLPSDGAPVAIRINQLGGYAAYIGQTNYVTSGTSKTTAQVTRTASVWDDDGESISSVANATATFTDVSTGLVLARGVKVRSFRAPRPVRPAPPSPWAPDCTAPARS